MQSNIGEERYSSNIASTALNFSEKQTGMLKKSSELKKRQKSNNQ